MPTRVSVRGWEMDLLVRHRSGGSHRRKAALVPMAVIATLTLAIAAPASATSNGAVAWGNNESGGLGNGTTEYSDVPVAVSGLSTVTAISAGFKDSLALL